MTERVSARESEKESARARERERKSDGESKRPLTWRERLADWFTRVQFVTYTILVIFLLLVGVLWKRIFVSIPSGHSGVMYRYFIGGTVTDRVWGEGLRILPPWDKLTVYETRLQTRKMKFGVLSEEGLDLGVEVAVSFRPQRDMLGYLHRDIGPDYFERLIQVEVQAHVRRTFGSRPAHELYSSARDVLQELDQVPLLGRKDERTQGFVAEGARPYIYIQELRLLDIALPKIVETAIADKYRQEQLMLEYKYRLEREDKESERKRSEAAGIRDYNLIANKISPDLLRWRGVEATLELAKSPNTKVVVLGGGQGGTPMLLNLVDGASGLPAAPPAAQEAPAAKAAPAPPPAPPPAAPPAAAVAPPDTSAPAAP